MERVAVVRCFSYEIEEVERSIHESLNLIGFEFKKNQKVLLKPNVLAAHNPGEGITTHPAVVEAVCRIFKKYNAEIFVGDSAGYDTKNALKVSGIERVARKYGKLVNFDNEKKFFVEINSRVKGVYLPCLINEIDLIVNLPKLKTHSSTRMTCCVKNLYGLIGGKSKMFYHKLFPRIEDFSLFLLEIYKEITPGLNIVDGVYGIEGNGPGVGGKRIKSNVISASRNAIALDTAMSELIGFNRNDILTNMFAVKNKIFDGDFEIVGSGRDLRLDYKKPVGLSSSRGIRKIVDLLPKPKIAFDYNKCTKCERCKKNCPVEAILMDTWPICEHDKCINCFCCIEMCPEGAVFLKENWAYSNARRVYRKIKKE